MNNNNKTILSSIFGTAKKISLYKFNHPSVQKAILTAYQQVATLLAKKNSLTVSRMEDGIVIEGELLGEKELYHADIKKLFDRLQIDSINFSKGLSAKELELFFKILIIKNSSVIEKGGISKILKKAGANHLIVNQIRYEKLSEEQTVTEEKDIYEITDTDNNDDDNHYDLEKGFEQLLKDEISSIVSSPDERERIYQLLFEKFNEELEDRIETETKELVSHNKKITFEKKRTESVIKSISDGLVVVDNQGKVMMMNPAAQNLFDDTAENMTGKNIMDSVKEEQMVSMSKESYKEDDSSQIKEIEVGGSEETQKTIRSSTAMIQDEDGKTVGMVSILTDVTKQKEMEKMKSDFLSNVSHELRSPMASIKQTISILCDGIAGTVNDTQKNFLENAKKSIKRLSRLINDLLDSAKLEAGKMDLKLQSSDIKTAIEDSIAGLEHWASSKEIALTIEIKTPVSNFFFDPDRIIQVLTNLISNAIKFSPAKSTVTVLAEAISSTGDAESDMVKISVQDSGAGIALEDQKIIFEKFKQVGGKASTDIKGTGLGLPITKDIVELHKGRIWVESEKGKGSTFIFVLPV